MQNVLKYKMMVKHEGDDDKKSWGETMIVKLSKDVSAEEHGKAVVAYFNRSLRPSESPRVFVSAQELRATTEELLAYIQEGDSYLMYNNQDDIQSENPNQEVIYIIQGIAGKFEDGLNRYNESPTFRAVINQLSRGSDEYAIIDSLVKMIESQNEQIQKMVENLPSLNFDKFERFESKS